MKELDVVKLYDDLVVYTTQDKTVKIPRGTAGTLVFDHGDGYFEIEFAGEHHGVTTTISEKEVHEIYN